MKNFRNYLLFTVFFLAGTCIFSAIPIEKPSLGSLSPGNARLRLIAAAENYLGTPYRYAGLDARGLDCSGLVFVSFRDSFNIQVPRTSSALHSWAKSIPREDLKPGDLVFFITDGRGISHVGIYTGGGRFIHAPSEGNITGVTYDSLSDSYWARTFAGAGRALPWDEEAELILSQGNPGSGNPRPNSRNVNPRNSASWSDSRGFFTGIGISPSFGSMVDGNVFRGMGFQAKAGYKGILSDSFQAALELRPQWDRFLGVGRLAFTVSLGTDTLQFFAGPAFTFGDPVLGSENQRAYEPGFSLLGEFGVSTALRPIAMPGGSLSIFMETAWQSYSSNAGTDFASDIAANLRISLGLRYLWLPGR